MLTPGCGELWGRQMSAKSPTQTPLDLLKEQVALSFITELQWGSRHFTYQKVQDKKVTQQGSHSTWWSHQVLKPCPFHPTLFIPSSHGTDSIFLMLFYLFPPLWAGNCYPPRITVADLGGSLGCYQPYTGRNLVLFPAFRMAEASASCVCPGHGL